MDNNIQNLSSNKVDDVFDLQGLHSKMNAEGTAGNAFCPSREGSSLSAGNGKNR